MAEVICPNCKTSFKIGNGENIVDANKLHGTVELVPETIRNENKGVNTMDLGTINFKGMTQEEKNEVLKAMGFNPFDFNTQSVDKTDSVVQEMYENGYVKNEKLHRRWITAQTIRLLGWYDGIRQKLNWCGNPCTVDYWTENVKKSYGWNYIFKQLKNEANAILHLGEDSPRRIFFSLENIQTIFREYIKEVEKYVYSLSKKNCKGLKYITVGDKNVFVEDIDKKVIEPIRGILIRRSLQGYSDVFGRIVKLRTSGFLVRLPSNTRLSPTWVECFKASGAYYTMENLVKYSGLKLMNYETKQLLDREESLQYLDSCKNNKGYQLLALLKKSLEANDFRFSEAIEK